MPCRVTLMKVGLYFGSFNPIHIGHMAIANYMVENTDMDQLWFVVSPQNPFKKRKTLLADHHRFELVERAIGDDDRFRATDIEFRKTPIKGICHYHGKRWLVLIS